MNFYEMEQYMYLSREKREFELDNAFRLNDHAIEDLLLLDVARILITVDMPGSVQMRASAEDMLRMVHDRLTSDARFHATAMALVSLGWEFIEATKRMERRTQVAVDVEGRYER